MAEEKSTEKQIPKSRENIILEAQRIGEAATYSAKGHFKAADIWGCFHYILGIPTSILAAVSATIVHSKVNSDGALPATLAGLAAMLAGITTFTNPTKKGNDHLVAGNNYNALFNDIHIFWTIDCIGASTDERLTAQLKDFAARKNTLNKNSPQIPLWAYYLAKRRIKAKEADLKAARQEKKRA